MRVLVIGINYRPELTGIGPYTADLAEHLASRGDEVTVIAGLPHYPAWRLGRGTSRALVASTSIAGVRVVRAAHFIPSRQDALRRGLYEATFGLTGAVASLRVARPDAILGVVPSLAGGALARLTGRRLRVPFGLLFQDLMGPAARQSGMAGGGFVASATSALERWAVRDAAAIGIVAAPFAAYLRAIGVPEARIVRVPNWTRHATPDEPRDAVRARSGWSDGCQVVLHAGNIGLKQGLGQVVDAARLAAQRGDPVLFAFSGTGSQAQSIRDQAVGLANVAFLGLQSDRMHTNLLSAADVLLLSERPSQVDMSLPSKLTAYFAAGRPVVGVVGSLGASAGEIERSGGGLVVPPGDPAALLDALARLRHEPQLGERLAAAGRAYAAAETSPMAGVARGATLIDRIAA